MRGEPSELAELRRLKLGRPELAEAADLHIALLEQQRRVKVRVPMPSLEVPSGWPAGSPEASRPLLRFSDIPLEWTDFRLLFRQTADLLLRFGVIEAEDHERLLALQRAEGALETAVARWFDGPTVPEGGLPDSPAEPPAVVTALGQAVGLAMRPFLERCAEAVQQRADFRGWTLPRCPVCGGEPDLAVLVSSGDRLLICGRCAARWRFDPVACPFCGNADRSRLPVFGSGDGLYRLYACDTCRRYLKAYDAPAGRRPVMPALDAVATLPLDAAAVQRGYSA
jgi:FdhE protein